MTAPLLSLLPGPFRKEATTDGGEYAGPCPWCGGDDRFRVWPDAERPHWWCRGCGRQGDAIAYLREHDGLSFSEAAAVVGRTWDAPVRPPMRGSRPPVDDGPPSAAWQERARELLALWQAALWSDAGAAARAYLSDRRGLSDATIRGAGLGYCAADLYDDPTRWSLDGDARIYVPVGIVIPCEIGGAVWYLKVRRPVGEPKYQQPRGSRAALYGADRLRGRKVLILVEGELDALLLCQEAGDLVDVATLGSATARLGPRWLTRLLPTRRILVAYDPDPAGTKGTAALAAVSGRVRIVQPPGTGDVTDAWQAGVGLREWVRGLLDEHLPRPSVPPLDQWDDEAASALVQATLRRVEAAWGATLEADRDHAAQAQLLEGLAAIESARQQRDMLTLRQSLAAWERLAGPIFTAYRAARDAREAAPAAT